MHVQAGLSRKASLGPRECACSTDVGCRTTPMWAWARAGGTGVGRARVRETTVCVDTCITGADSRRNAAAQWQRNLFIIIRTQRPTAKQAAQQRRESPPVVHRAQPRARPPRAKRVCAQGARARPGNGSISRRVLTPHGPWRKAARVH